MKDDRFFAAIFLLTARPGANSIRIEVSKSHISSLDEHITKAMR